MIQRTRCAWLICSSFPRAQQPGEKERAWIWLFTFYIDSNFEGPSLLPDVRRTLDCDPCNACSSFAGSLMSEFSSQDPAKKQFAEALLAFTDAFNIAILIYSL